MTMVMKMIVWYPKKRPQQSWHVGLCWTKRLLIMALWNNGRMTRWDKKKEILSRLWASDCCWLVVGEDCSCDSAWALLTALVFLGGKRVMYSGNGDICWEPFRVLFKKRMVSRVFKAMWVWKRDSFTFWQVDHRTRSRSLIRDLVVNCVGERDSESFEVYQCHRHSILCDK